MCSLNKGCDVFTKRWCYTLTLTVHTESFRWYSVTVFMCQLFGLNVLMHHWFPDVFPLEGPEWDDRAALLTQQLQQLPAGLQRVQRLQGAHPGRAPEGSDLVERSPAKLHRGGQNQPEQAAAPLQQHQRPAGHSQLCAALRGKQGPSAPAHGMRQKQGGDFQELKWKKKKIPQRTP